MERGCVREDSLHQFAVATECDRRCVGLKFPAVQEEEGDASVASVDVVESIDNRDLNVFVILPNVRFQNLPFLITNPYRAMVDLYLLVPRWRYVSLLDQDMLTIVCTEHGSWVDYMQV